MFKARLIVRTKLKYCFERILDKNENSYFLLYCYERSGSVSGSLWLMENSELGRHGTTHPNPTQRDVTGVFQFTQPYHRNGWAQITCNFGGNRPIVCKMPRHFAKWLTSDSVHILPRLTNLFHSSWSIFT